VEFWLEERIKMTMLGRKDIEIMAPAGSWESLRAAIAGGADSVYFGVEQLNMRAGSSNNFTVADLEEIASICRQNGLKSYITLNVVVFDEEVEQMRGIIDAAAKSGINAVIASDLAVINYAFGIGMEVHLSTQLNISNVEALRFYSQWADVAVLARELDLKKVKHIHETIVSEGITGPKGAPVKIEMFAHGALCMAISGKCYLSLHESNMSANRGTCHQICRRGYTVTEKETGSQLDIENQYIMSPKDLCTIGFMDKMVDAGVRVFKIEGRARSAEYVKTVCECYGEAAAAVVDGSYGGEKIVGWRERLSTVFNRGFWDGYYLGQKLGEWNNRYGSSATMRKIYLGKVTNYFQKLKVAEIKLETGDLNVGDTIMVIGPTTGIVEYRVGEIRVELQSAPKASKGEYCSIPAPDFLRRSDKVYLWVKSQTDN